MSEEGVPIPPEEPQVRKNVQTPSKHAPLSSFTEARPPSKKTVFT